WVGLKVLGVHPGNVADTTDKQITFYASNYAPGSPPRDSTRFGYLTTGKITCMTCDAGLEPQSGDPVTVLAVGPFHELDPGDSVQVDFAFVGGQEVTDLQRHARAAQRAFDNNYIVPIPPPSPRDSVIAHDGEIEIFWD